MEMNDQALQHIMNVQTQMLQHLTRIQEGQLAPHPDAFSPPRADLSVPPLVQQGMSEQHPVNISPPPVDPGAFSSGAITPDDIPGPTQPLSVSDPTERNVRPLSASDPTEYATYAAPQTVGGRLQEMGSQPTLFDERGLVGGTMAQMRDFEGMRHSKEATAQFFTEQARGIQERSVDMVTGAAGAAGAMGSMFVPGILPALGVGAGVALGVGGTAGALSGGARTSLDYQQMLQQDSYRFINPLESTDEMGGIGLGLDDRQEISRFLRDLAPEEFLDDDEMRQILDGAMSNNLLKTVNDVDTFKDKFSEIVDTVKQITVSLNKTVDEAAEFMGEMERQGILHRDMSYIASQTKVTGSMLGISPDEAFARMSGTTDQIVHGGSMDATGVMTDVGQSMFMAQLISDRAQDVEDPMFNYIRNVGGEDVAGAQFGQASRSYVESQSGQEMLLGMFGSAFTRDEMGGGFTIDDAEMRRLLTDESISVNEMQQQSQSALRQFDSGELATLSNQITSLFNQWAGGAESAQFLDRSTDLLQERAAQTGVNLDDETALMEMGIAQDYDQARFFQNMIGGMTDEQAAQVYTAMSYKESQDAHAISNNPTLFQRMRFGFQRNFVNPIGNVGQGISDQLGGVMQNYQQFITGVEDRNLIGGQLPYTLDQSGMAELLEGVGVVNEASQAMAGFYGERHDEIMEGGTGGVQAHRARNAASAQADRESIEFDPQDLLESAFDTSIDQMDNRAFSVYRDQAREGTLGATGMRELNELRNDEEADLSVIEQRRISMIEDELRGEYDGFIGGTRRVFDTLAERTASAGVWAIDNTVGRVMDSPSFRDLYEEASEAPTSAERSLMDFQQFEEDVEALEDRRQDLLNQTVDLFDPDEGGITDVSSDELRMLEKYIEAGEVDRVSEMTQSPEAVALAEEFRAMQELEGEVAEAGEFINELQRYTGAMAQTPGQLADFLNQTNLYDESHIDSLTGTAVSEGEDILDALQDGDLSPEELTEAFGTMEAHVSEVFSRMGHTEMHELAEYLSAQDQSQKMEDFYLEGTTSVDSDRLQDYIVNDILRQQHYGEGMGAPDEATPESAAKDHEDAMFEFLSAFQNETEMLKDATEGRPVRNNSSLSGPYGG